MGEYADLYDEQSLVQELYEMEDPDDIFDEWGIPTINTSNKGISQLKKIMIILN